MAELLVLNSMTSASEILMRMEISTTTHSMIYKPILPIIQLYTMTMTRKAVATTAVMMTMKIIAMTIMMLTNKKKSKTRLGVAGIVVLIVIQKK